MNKYPQIHKDNGPFVSSQHWSDADRQDTEVFFHHSQKAEVMMTATSSWYGGDFFEFGSHDLNTFRDFLTAYDICGMTRAYQDVKFYGFDVFGKLEEDVGSLKEYFEPYSKQGDRLEHHQGLIQQYGLYVDKCHLIQGLFKNTLTPEFKASYGDRKIGFASLDCNMPSSYKTVFEFIFDMMAENSYIYMDEGFQSPEVLSMWSRLVEQLILKRKMNAAYMRNAAGFGSLWRLYPIIESPLDL